ncbi:MAG: tyrosine--tRNA ligase [Phycisphaerales bacterium JB063]
MTTIPTTDNLYDVLHARGLVAQCTDDKIRERLAKPLAAYIGFDPTADALHVGSLVQMMLLAHVQRCGHKPVVLVGGATGLVGDPSGKTDARQMLTPEVINHNAQCIAKQIGKVVRFGEGPTDAVLVNNLDWFGSMGWIDMLREVGARMSVNRMMSMESVKGRMTGEGEGISYLEFSYMLMQGYDFAHLFKQHGCTLQMGGQDQWGNIVIGIDLGRRLHDADLAGLTTPLVTRADGGKFGKSEQGNVWLDKTRTSVFDFFQFWRNVSDADVGRFLGFFTFLPMDEVNALASAQGKDINASKVRLAYEVTKLVHGEAEAEKARDTAQRAYSAAADLTGDAIPSEKLDPAELNAGVGVLALLVRAGLAKSNSEARRLIQGGGVRLHETKVEDPNRMLGPADVTDGMLLLRAGKKRMFRFDVG